MYDMRVSSPELNDTWRVSYVIKRSRVQSERVRDGANMVDL